MKCSACGAKLEPGQAECPDCEVTVGSGRLGVKKEARHECPECGSMYDSTWDYCPECGTWLSSSKSREGDY